MESLSFISNKELCESIGKLRGQERECLAEVVRHLAEIDQRGVFRDWGYSSLFVYCRDGLGYVEASAYRRVQAARALKRHPEIYEKLKAGTLTLYGVGEVMKVQEREKRGELLQRVEGKSRREVEEIVLPFKAPEISKPERVCLKRVAVAKPLENDLFADQSASEARKMQTQELEFQVSFSASQEFMDLFARVKALVPGYQPDMKAVFECVLREYEKRHSPVEREKRRAQRKKKASVKRTRKPGSRPRAIGAAVRDRVVIRDGAQCSFISDDGVRCGCREGLEFDHIRPRGLGGANNASNLRLLCRAHNQLAAEQVYGREFMQSKIAERCAHEIRSSSR